MFRLSTQHSTKPNSQNNNLGRKRVDSHGKREVDVAQLLAKVSVPRYKGNPDPFNATIVSLTAIRHVWLQHTRAQSMMNTWPSEIASRSNHGTFLAASWRMMPQIGEDKTSSHALIAHALYNSGSRLQNQGQSDEEASRAAAKHKFHDM